MIDTVGLLLELDEECRLSTHVFVDDIVQNWKYLRNQKAYFPYIELLPDEKIKVEFCPAKLLYGQNLYEIHAEDMASVLVNLAAYLNKAFVYTCPAILFYAHVYRIDYAKVCYRATAKVSAQQSICQIRSWACPAARYETFVCR